LSDALMLNRVHLLFGNLLLGAGPHFSLFTNRLSNSDCRSLFCPY